MMLFRSTAIAVVLCCIGLAQVRAQTPKVLTGLNYKGTSEAIFQEGCEGCGNPGHIEFKEGNSAEFTLPGSDIIGSLHYGRKGDMLRISDSDWTMELKGDSLFFTAYDYRHAYVRVRKE
ncbi:MAG: hypothetical protein K8H89_09925 [Flavobacteriales bacterium]|jgi:hypothetical protein|nr:hypothetical protein [Flavobacteriales bacterium]